MKQKVMYISTVLTMLMLLFSFTTHTEAAGGRIAFGDSNTEGNMLKAAGISERYNWTAKAGAINKGLSGDTTAHAMNRFQKDVLDLNPKEVILMFGTNDAVVMSNGEPKVSKANFEKNMRSMIRTLKKRRVTVVLMTNIPVIQGFFYERNEEAWYTDKGGVRLWQDSYNNIIRQLAKEERTLLVDNYKNAIHKAGGGTDGGLYASGLIDRTGTHWAARGADMISYSVNRVLK